MLKCLSRCEGQASRAGLGLVLLKSYGQWNNVRVLLNADSAFLISSQVILMLLIHNKGKKPLVYIQLPHFTNMKSETNRVEQTCPKSHSLSSSQTKPGPAVLSLGQTVSILKAGGHVCFGSSLCIPRPIPGSTEALNKYQLNECMNGSSSMGQVV